MCLACGCDVRVRERAEIAIADPARPTPDEAILIAVEDTLADAERWLGWNGATTIGGGSVWTPLKSMRRITDHFIDHIAEIECRLSGAISLEDTWHGRTVTMDGDW